MKKIVIMDELLKSEQFFKLAEQYEKENLKGLAEYCFNKACYLQENKK